MQHSSSTHVLEQKTKTYWLISKGFNLPENPDAPNQTISSAIKEITELSYELGPKRQLLRSNIEKLRNNLIQYGRKPTKSKQASIGKVSINKNGPLPSILQPANR